MFLQFPFIQRKPERELSYKRAQIKQKHCTSPGIKLMLTTKFNVIGYNSDKQNKSNKEKRLK